MQKNTVKSYANIIVLAMMLTATTANAGNNKSVQNASDNVVKEDQENPTQLASSPTENDYQEKKPAFERIAKQLNSQGYHQYKNGNYVQALRLFRRAVKKDENYALAQYNLACTIAIALDRCLEELADEDEELINSISRDTIFSALKKSIKLDPKRLERSKTDADLVDIRKSYRYNREILGYDKNDDAQLQMILHNVDWQSTGMRLYHTEPAVRLIFHEDGRVQVKIANFIEGKIPENSLPWNHTYRNGQYRVKDGVITLQFNGKTIQGTLSEDGTLTFPDAEKSAILPTDIYRFSRPDCFNF